MHPSTSSRRLWYVEQHAKRYNARSLAVVGCSDDALVRKLVVNFPLCKLTACPSWRTGLLPSKAAQQRNYQRNLKQWAVAYAKRFRVLAAPDDEQYDVVVLWCPEAELADAGKLWAGRVKTGGWLLGIDHRIPGVREFLGQVVPGWKPFLDGIWGKRVKAVDHPAQEAGEDVLTLGEIVGGHPAPGIVVAHDSECSKPEKDSVSASPVTVAPKRRGRPPKVKAA